MGVYIFYGDGECTFGVNYGTNYNLNSFRFIGDSNDIQKRTMNIFDKASYGGNHQLFYTDMPNLNMNVVSFAMISQNKLDCVTVYTETNYNGLSYCIKIQNTYEKYTTTQKQYLFIKTLKNISWKGITQVKSFKFGCFSTNIIETN